MCQACISLFLARSRAAGRVCAGGECTGSTAKRATGRTGGHAEQVRISPCAVTALVKPGVLAASLAVLPGFLVHGAGAFAIGDRSTARKLALSEAGGLTTFLAAGSLIALTGTSRKLIGVLAPITIAGFGVFVLGFLADVYAASTGGRPDQAPNFVAKLDAEVGYLYVYDPQFAFGSFLTARSDLRAGSFRASPEAQVALDNDTSVSCSSSPIVHSVARRGAPHATDPTSI